MKKERKEKERGGELAPTVSVGAKTGRSASKKDWKKFPRRAWE